MNETIVPNKNWWQRHWKWFIPTAIISVGILLFALSGLGSSATDFTRAYAEKDIFHTAIDKVEANDQASKVLGDIEPMDQLAILEGAVIYSNDNTSFKSSTRIVGSKARGSLDIIADKVDDVWVYQLIKVRVKKPKDQIQTIEILDLE